MALIYLNDFAGGAGRYDLHDIVDICDDCTVNLPPAPPFRILKVAGVTKAQVVRFLAAHTDGQSRRLWKLDLAPIPAAWKAAFLADRYGEVTLAQARKYVLNKATGLHDDGT